MFNTIKIKMMLGVFLIVFVLLFSSSGFQLYRSRTILLSGMLDEVAHLSIPLKLNLRKSLDQFSDSTEFKELLRVYASIMGLTDFSLLTESEVLLQKVNFVELNGKIIADSDKKNLGRDIKEFLKFGLKNPEHSLFEEDNQVFIFEPFIFKGQHLGTFIFIFSNSSLIEERNRVFWVAGSLFVFFMFLGGIGAWLLSYTLSKPITYLINSSQVIASGNLDHPIDTVRKDELGILTQSFAKMRDSIKNKIIDLHSQRIYLSNLIDSMPSLLIDLDTDGKIIKWNKKAEQTTGITAGVAHGKTLFDVFSVDVDNSSLENALTNSEKGNVLETEVVLQHKDGSSHTYLTVIYPMYDVADKDSGVCAIFTDITERKHAEEELKKHHDHLEDMVIKRTAELEKEITERKQIAKQQKESEAKWRALTESSPNHIMLLDLDNTIQYINFTVPNLTKEQVLGKPNIELFPPDYQQVATDCFERVIQSGRNDRFETAYTTAVGETQYFDVRISAIKDVNEKITGLISTSNNITDRKLAEKEIKASLKEKEVLLREIHHRTKNNMQVVSSLLALQADRINDQKYVNLLKDSQERIKSMALIHEKLYQSKDFTKLDFSTYVEALVNGLVGSHVADPGKIVIKTEVENILIGLDNGIPCGLIINELVSNSLKYAFSPDRSGEIRIVLRLMNENEVELTVSDDGIGVPEGLDFRNNDSLGLHLVKILVERQLNGKIELDRTKGTKFHIRFEVTPDKVRI